MIVQTIQRNVVESHDFKSEIATIDAEEMRYVSSLLRNNYSDTILATVREIFANAVDANSGSDKPIDIFCPTAIDSTFKVRDYGKGLSEDDLFGLYTKYGRSTKRNENFSIGGFGIGRFAPLSYTDSFTVTSIHNGQKTVISVYVDEHGDTRFTRLYNCQTADRSGIEISVAVKSENINDFNFAVNRVLQFADVKINCNIKIKPVEWVLKNKNWGITQDRNFNGDCLVVMGGIAYPLNFSVFSNFKGADSKIFNLFKNSYAHQNFVFFFPVGSVSLHHSRESLEYNQQTKSYIFNAILQLEKDINETVQKELDPINDSHLFCKKIADYCNSSSVSSLCYNSELIFTAADGSKHKIVPSNSIPVDSAFKISNRSKNIVRHYKRDKTPHQISIANAFEYTIENSSILINDGQRNIFGRVQAVMMNNPSISVVSVVSLENAKKILLDYSSNSSIFWASKVDPISTEKKKQYDSVRIIFEKNRYISSFANKCPMPDAKFYYLKLFSSGRGNNYHFKFNNDGHEYGHYDCRQIIHLCAKVGIDTDKVYGVVGEIALPDYAIDISDAFSKKFEALKQKFKSFINDDAVAAIYRKEINHYHVFKTFADGLPSDHAISQYLKHCIAKHSSDLKEEYKNFISSFDGHISNHNDEVSAEKVHEIRQKALTILSRYPMIVQVINNRYGFNLSEETSKIVIDYINLVDKSS